MKSIFKHIDHQNEFDKNGYLLMDAIGEQEILQLRDYYFKYINFTNESLFRVGLYMESRDQVVKMKEFIKQICIPNISKHLGETSFVTASFVVKFPSQQGIVPVHQDWSFVEEEEQYYSTTCWIPLVDVNIDNGAIGIIRGSNRYFDTIRPSPSRYLKNDLSEHGQDIFSYMHLVEMKAGKALFFNNATFHGSTPNLSNEIRLAVGLSFTHKQARPVHYYLNPHTKGKTAIKYEVDEEFFMKYNDPLLNTMFENGETIQDYPIINEVPYHPPMVGKEKLLEMIIASGNTLNPILQDKIKDIQTSSYGEVKTSTSEPGKDAGHIEKKDTRTFFQTYTPKNILLEINYRIKKLFKTT